MNPDFKVNILGPQMVVTIDRHQMWTQSIVGIKTGGFELHHDQQLSVPL